MSIILKDLVLQRGDFKIGPVQFEFNAPGLYLIKGANGAGKTSLLKAILGRLRPQRGSIKRSDTQIASVGIEPTLYSEWTPNQNFIFQSELTGEHGRSQFQSTMKFANYFQVGHLSSGQRRMVELDIALSLTCSTVLLDEPGNSLDSQNLKNLESRLIEESKSRLIIMTSHLHADSDLPFRNILELSS